MEYLHWSCKRQGMYAIHGIQFSGWIFIKWWPIPRIWRMSRREMSFFCNIPELNVSYAKTCFTIAAELFSSIQCTCLLPLRSRFSHHFVNIWSWGQPCELSNLNMICIRYSASEILKNKERFPQQTETVISLRKALVMGASSGWRETSC